MFATLSTHVGTCNLSTTQGKEGAVGTQREGWGRGLTAPVAPSLACFPVSPRLWNSAFLLGYGDFGSLQVRESEHCSQKSNTCLPCGP